MPAAGPEDPVVTSSRREALIVFAVWFCAMIYTVGFCYLHGFDRPAESIQYVLGFPDWVFWGVVVPWMVCMAFSWVFTYVIMTDDPLGDDPDLPASQEADNA